MIRIQIDIVTDGKPDRPVGQVLVGNDQTGNEDISNHDVTVLPLNESGDMVVRDKARIEGFERSKSSHFHLAFYALAALLRLKI